MATTTENPNTATTADATNATTVYTGEFHGDLKGNADTATQLQKPWRLTIAKDADGYTDINAGDTRLEITVKNSVSAKTADQAIEVGKAASASYAELANLATFAENSGKTELATRAIQDEKGNSIVDTYMKVGSAISKAQYDAAGNDISLTYQRKDIAANQAIADGLGNNIAETYAPKNGTIARATADADGAVISETYQRIDTAAPKAIADINGESITDTYARKDGTIAKATGDAEGNSIADTYARKDGTVAQATADGAGNNIADTYARKDTAIARATADANGDVIPDTYAKKTGLVAQATSDALGNVISDTYARKDTSIDRATGDEDGENIKSTYARKENTVFFDAVKVTGMGEGTGSIKDNTLTIELSKVIDVFENHVVFNALPEKEEARNKYTVYLDYANQKFWIYDQTSQQWKDCFEQIVTAQKNNNAKVETFQGSIDELHNDVIDIQNKQIQQEASITTNYNKNVEQDVRITRLEGDHDGWDKRISNIESSSYADTISQINSALNTVNEKAAYVQANTSNIVTLSGAQTITGMKTIDGRAENTESRLTLSNAAGDIALFNENKDNGNMGIQAAAGTETLFPLVVHHDSSVVLNEVQGIYGKQGQIISLKC